jgi:hypothetical protein
MRKSWTPRAIDGVPDRLTFDIDVKFPLIGQLIHYRGWLTQQ